jgi:predicted DsbA family dithiol-disulfide isomerase
VDETHSTPDTILMKPLLMEVWSDYVCPFCYLEEPAVAQIEQLYAEQIHIFWRAFELRPHPVPTLDPQGEYLTTIWDRAVYPMARQRGMNLRLPPVQPRSRLAHEAAFFAQEHGRFSAMNHLIFQAFFEQGRNIGDPAELVQLGTTIGLDPAELSQALTSRRYETQVLEHQTLAHDLGISGVPAILIRPAHTHPPEGYLIEGAQPFEAIDTAIRRLLNSSKQA